VGAATCDTTVETAILMHTATDAKRYHFHFPFLSIVTVGYLLERIQDTASVYSCRNMGRRQVEFTTYAWLTLCPHVSEARYFRRFSD
jgi:hypothetical protein